MKKQKTKNKKTKPKKKKGSNMHAQLPTKIRKKKVLEGISFLLM